MTILQVLSEMLNVVIIYILKKVESIKINMIIEYKVRENYIVFRNRIKNKKCFVSIKETITTDTYNISELFRKCGIICNIYDNKGNILKGKFTLEILLKQMKDSKSLNKQNIINVLMYIKENNNLFPKINIKGTL